MFLHLDLMATKWSRSVSILDKLGVLVVRHGPFAGPNGFDFVRHEGRQSVWLAAFWLLLGVVYAYIKIGFRR